MMPGVSLPPRTAVIVVPFPANHAPAIRTWLRTTILESAYPNYMDENIKDFLYTVYEKVIAEIPK
jgi:hypothetical protein